jgi:hypothetical protein
MYRKQFVGLGYDFLRRCGKESIAAAWISPTGIKWTKLARPSLDGESVLGAGAVIGRTLFAAGDGPSPVDKPPEQKFDERDPRIWAGRTQ